MDLGALHLTAKMPGFCIPQMIRRHLRVALLMAELNDYPIVTSDTLMLKATGQLLRFS